jgi:hypothetical protein
MMEAKGYESITVQYARSLHRYRLRASGSSINYNANPDAILRGNLRKGKSIVSIDDIFGLLQERIFERFSPSAGDIMTIRTMHSVCRRLYSNLRGGTDVIYSRPYESKLLRDRVLSGYTVKYGMFRNGDNTPDCVRMDERFTSYGRTHRPVAFSKVDFDTISVDDGKLIPRDEKSDLDEFNEMESLLKAISTRLKVSVTFVGLHIDDNDVVRSVDVDRYWILDILAYAIYGLNFETDDSEWVPNYVFFNRYIASGIAELKGIDVSFDPWCFSQTWCVGSVSAMLSDQYGLNNNSFSYYRRRGIESLDPGINYYGDKFSSTGYSGLYDKVIDCAGHYFSIVLAACGGWASLDRYIYTIRGNAILGKKGESSGRAYIEGKGLADIAIADSLNTPYRTWHSILDYECAFLGAEIMLQDLGFNMPLEVVTSHNNGMLRLAHKFPYLNHVISDSALRFILENNLHDKLLVGKTLELVKAMYGENVLTENAKVVL